LEDCRVTTVAVGSNHFVDCQTIVAVGQHALLQVVASPLRVTLRTPPDLPQGRAVQVVDNAIAPNASKSLRVISSDTSVAVFWEETPLVIATLIEAAVVSVRVDLRSIGINLFDDTDGLHVGSNRLTGNQISCASVAITLR
jgi:hypothetical protein